MSIIRLQKHIANLGITSRRKAEDLIVDGKVTVNGETVTELGTKVDSDTDAVEVADTPTKETTSSKYYYVALNKPVGYISSSDNSQGASVIDLITAPNFVKGRSKLLNTDVLDTRLYPIGRLDKDSEGLILLTNDGKLTNKLTHPRYSHEKEYEIIIDKNLTGDAKKVLKKGMVIDDDIWVNGITIKKEFTAGKRTIVTVILQEGKNRQLRKMFGRLGYKVISLKRTRMGKLKLGTLPTGKWKLVQKSQII